MLLNDTDVSGYHQQDHCFKIIKAAASLFAISLPYQTKPLITTVSLSLTITRVTIRDTGKHGIVKQWYKNSENVYVHSMQAMPLCLD